MMMQIPIDIAPTSTASARFFSSTISFHKSYGVNLSIDDKRTDEDGDADEREDERRPDVQHDIHHFPPVKRPKPPYTGRYDPGLSRTDLGTVRASLNEVSRQPRYSRGTHQADDDEVHTGDTTWSSSSSSSDGSAHP